MLAFHAQHAAALLLDEPELFHQFAGLEHCPGGAAKSLQAGFGSLDLLLPGENVLTDRDGRIAPQQRARGANSLAPKLAELIDLSLQSRAVGPQRPQQDMEEVLGRDRSLQLASQLRTRLHLLDHLVLDLAEPALVGGTDRLFARACPRHDGKHVCPMAFPAGRACQLLAPCRCRQRLCAVVRLLRLLRRRGRGDVRVEPSVATIAAEESRPDEEGHHGQLRALRLLRSRQLIERFDQGLGQVRALALVLRDVRRRGWPLALAPGLAALGTWALVLAGGGALARRPLHLP
jgi:hypothetical protein